MVSSSYMLAKPPRLSKPKLFLDQRVVPAAIDMAGSVEVTLQRLSQRTGIRSSLLLGGLTAIVSGAILGRLLRTRRR